MQGEGAGARAQPAVGVKVSVPEPGPAQPPCTQPAFAEAAGGSVKGGNSSKVCEAILALAQLL